MLDLALDILSLVLGPQTWRGLPGPAAVAGAVFWSVVGALVTAFGAASWANALTTQDHLFAVGEFTLGLLVLGDVIFGLIAFFRANRERA
jgi:hypothetical protein